MKFDLNSRMKSTLNLTSKNKLYDLHSKFIINIVYIIKSFDKI